MILMMFNARRIKGFQVYYCLNGIAFNLFWGGHKGSVQEGNKKSIFCSFFYNTNECVEKILCNLICIKLNLARLSIFS
jgi:hypothetical protein